ncbi:N-acetylglucosaminyl deacetylase, LmbE family [Pedobacter terrae]|uniref:N-acetylglucosaminyl deacetylase, LmbE family n=1 Tax=Pedobacter terrae TaxID=405671 RepID=A0A1G7UAI4_9SPHI|nr:PIG-L family deacetylase [Pedobacter terrae]SDG44311.1 N-acetylglucosaminyl deacetylase, LmbE family [Pedobacter terrae]
MFKRLTAIFILCLTVIFCAAQQIRPAKSSEIYRELKTLKHLPKVLYLAAHPDDENTGLLSWLINDQHVETAYLSLTRGDGGQNLLGTEQGAALGLIRTHELLEARRLDGAQQFFTRAIDFGFSKNTNDTFKQWDADSITADVVWVIRKFRPDVIICRFPPTAAAGHGQHAASAVVAEKAFKAAADKNMFPEQLKYVAVWQPKRLLWNTFRFGAVNTTAENQLKVAVGQYDAQLGMGYGELAGLSRSLHKSQGAGTQSVAGVRTEYFTNVLGDPAKRTLFDGLNMNWSDKGIGDIDELIDITLLSFNYNQPDKSLHGLLMLRKKIAELQDVALRKDKLAAIDNIILSSAGFMGEVVTNQPEAIAGNSYNFRLNLISRSATPVKVESVNWLNQTDNLNRTLANDSLITIERKIQIPADAAPTEPYWLTKPAKNAATFSVVNDTLIGLPEMQSPINVLLSLKIESEKFAVRLPLSYKKLDPVKGDVVEALRIIPVLDLSFSEPVYFAKGKEALNVGLRLKANKNINYGKITFKIGNQVVKTFQGINLAENTVSTMNFLIPVEDLAKIKTSQNKLEAVFSSETNEYSKGQVLIQYPHLPTLQYFVPATTWLIKGDIRVLAKKIGYIEGAGDLIPEFLRQAGLQVDVLTEADILSPAKLASYDAVVTGVRVINTEKRIKNWQTALRSYVENGGTIVMQYNTTQDMALQDFGIYPFNISGKRVTEENAAVKFLKPDHKLLNYPNKITAEDFKGWVQERGAYFPDQWDAKYETLFEMHDTDEEPLQGSTLYAKYGKGNFIYTPLAFFRQLPAGNVGAARLFFNFLSAGK